MKRLLLVLFSLTVFGFWTSTAFGYGGGYSPGYGGGVVQPPQRPQRPPVCPDGLVKRGHQCVRPPAQYQPICPYGSYNCGARPTPPRLIVRPPVHRPQRPPVHRPPVHRPQLRIIKQRVCNAHGCRIVHKKVWR